MQENQIKAYIQYNDQKLDVKTKGMTVVDELYVDTYFDTLENGFSFKLYIHAKQKITLKKVVAIVDCQNKNIHKIFSNGFQSWSESREYSPSEEIPNLISFTKPFMQNYGDYFFNLKRGKGKIHSWTYTYLKENQKNNIQLFASLNERTGYTIFTYDHSSQKLIIEKDCEGLELSHSFPALEFIHLNGKNNDVFEQWFNTFEIQKPKVKPAIGWTSWYHYYTKINEEIILKNLNAFSEKNIKIDFFQIDDGYQNRVGDWLDIHTEKFPKGMKYIADKIHGKNIKAGLWLAPFVVEKKSKIFQQHQEWLLKDEKGKLISAGYNPMWSGHFYILDIYNSQVKEYLSGVFFTIFNKWNFDMVKLDFLYAAAILPRKNKTRGQVMFDAMEFLRKTCTNKIILGCGVPLGAAFGQVDYCRIGADIHLSWEHQLLKLLNNRERVSTIAALRSVLGRWQLNNRAFLNDPDVFILRNNKNKLSPIQQNTILTINTLLGKLIFTSDDISEYSDEQLDEFRSIYKWINSEIENVIQDNNYYEIYFINNNIQYCAYSNLNSKSFQKKIKNTTLQLEPFETMILRI